MKNENIIELLNILSNKINIAKKNMKKSIVDVNKNN